MRIYAAIYPSTHVPLHFLFCAVYSLSVTAFAALLRDVPHAPSPLSRRASAPVVDCRGVCCRGSVPVVDCVRDFVVIDSRYGNLDYRNAGRVILAPGRCSSALFRVEVSKCRSVEVSKCRSVEVPKCRSVEVSRVGPPSSDHRAALDGSAGGGKPPGTPLPHGQCLSFLQFLTSENSVFIISSLDELYRWSTGKSILFMRYRKTSGGCTAA